MHYLLQTSFALANNTEYVVYIDSSNVDGTVLKFTHSKGCLTKNEKTIFEQYISDDEIDSLIDMLQQHRNYGRRIENKED